MRTAPRLLATCLALLSLLFAAPRARAAEPAYDLLIRNGTIVDGSGNPWYRGNVASYVGLDNVWQGAMGNSYERPTAAQKEEMKAIIEEAMKDGAFGLSSMLAMPPGSLAETDDIIELCKVVAKYNGIYSTHNR